MKFNDSIKKLAISTFAMVMLLGIGFTADANAQGRYDQDRYGNYNQDQVRWTKDRTRQYAYLLGYHQSYSEGRDLREQGYRGNGKDTQGYRNDSNGFLTWMGFQNDYRSQYRRGYEEGFRDAQTGRTRRYDRDDVERVLGGNLKEVYGSDQDYDDRDGRWGRGRNRDRDRDNRDGRFDRQDVLRLAQQEGYQDGLRVGQDARRYNRRGDYRNTNEYRNGLGGFRGDSGDRSIYQQAYRDAFRRGYEEGYRRR